MQAVLTQQLEQMAQTSALAWRADQLGQTPPPAPTGATAGFLLRSALASGWPGLSVSGTCAGKPVPLLRLDHVGAGVLIALFNGVPDTVVFNEPQENLEFGVNDEGEVGTRKISQSHVVNGTPVKATIRAGGQRVLNISSLLESLAAALNVAPPPPSARRSSPCRW